MIDEWLRDLVNMGMRQAAETLHKAQVLIAGHCSDPMWKQFVGHGFTRIDTDSERGLER